MVIVLGFGVTYCTVIVTRIGSKPLFYKLGKLIEEWLCTRLIEIQRVELNLLNSQLALSMYYLELMAWPGLAWPGPWKLDSPESGKFHSLPLPACSPTTI